METVSKASQPIQMQSVARYNIKGIYLIVGLACLAGFLVDLAVLSYPANPGALEWRTGFIQQVSDRSIILLFAAGLLLAGLLDARAWRKRLALLCMVTGVAFLLSCLLVLRDSSILQQQTLNRINTQAEQAETQLAQIDGNSELGAQVTPEQVEQLRQRISLQKTTLEGNTKTGILKSGVSSVGNLSIVGLALIGLGRFGMNPPRLR